MDFAVVLLLNVVGVSKDKSVDTIRTWSQAVAHHFHYKLRGSYETYDVAMLNMNFVSRLRKGDEV
jgi:hypothetical protein